MFSQEILRAYEIKCWFQKMITRPAVSPEEESGDPASKMEVKFDKDNVFCLDNEAFHFLVSCKHNINFPEEDRKSFADSWEQSASECWRLIRYVTTRCRLSPHFTEKTISVNRARNVILQLSKPLADIADLISDNIALVQKFKNCLRKEESVIKDLEGRLYIPQVDLEIVPLQHPVTICTNFKCCEIYTVQGIKKTYYKQLCHDRCYLDSVPKELIGPPALVDCYAMDHPSKLCYRCKCDFSSHMHVYYLTKTCQKDVVNPDVQSRINDKKLSSVTWTKSMEKVELLMREYEAEKDVIMKCMAKFGRFLKRNAIVSYNDAYEDYINYLIDRENSLGTEADGKVIAHYRRLLKEYVAEKLILNEVSSDESDDAMSEEVFDSVQQLFSLKHTGRSIRELYSQESQLRSKEAEQSRECVLEDFFTPERDESPAAAGVAGGDEEKELETNTDQIRNVLLGKMIKWYWEKKFKK